MSIDIEYLADHSEFVPQIASWYFSEWGHKEPNNSIERISERLNTNLNRNHLPIPIVAIENGKLVGIAQLKIREMAIYPNREFWLGGVYVDSLARGKGIGELLVRRIEEISKQLGINELYLQTEKLNGGLYAKLKWLPIEQVDNKNVQIVIMQKKLQNDNYLE